MTQLHVHLKYLTTNPYIQYYSHTFLYTTISYSQDCHGSPCSCFLQDVKTFACSASPKWNNGQMKWYCLRDYDKLYGLEATPTHYYSEGRCHFKEIEHNISHLSSFIKARTRKNFGKFKIYHYNIYFWQSIFQWLYNFKPETSPSKHKKMDLTNYLAWLPFAYPQIGGHLRPSLLTRRKIAYIWEKRPASFKIAFFVGWK